MRSVAVLVAAGIAYMTPVVTPEDADAFASLMVSIIIIASLAPLVQGLYYTALEIHEMTVNKPPTEVTLRV